MTLSSRKRSNSSSSKIINLDWICYIAHIYELCDKITASKIKFKYIYGIPRGGYIPAVILSHNTNKKLIENLYDIEDKNTNLLVVDDIVDTSTTITNLLANLQELRYCKKVYTATLYKHKKCKYTPDFFVEETNAWIRFPYEKE